MQQGKCEEVVLKARLSEKEKKGKWYIRNAATFKVFIVVLILDGNSVHVAHILRIAGSIKCLKQIKSRDCYLRAIFEVSFNISTMVYIHIQLLRAHQQVP